ncbi:CaiB/BaiF CoA transferase family protein [Thermodesulfobacteriota bacterium]
MIDLLKGTKILDLSRQLPGPLCSMYLADMGAEVLKIEDTIGGDITRWDPPIIKENSAFFLLINRNKKSLKLNLKAPEGYEIFCRLLKDADVVIEQFRPGVVERLKVDYQTLIKLKPDLVYCSLTGFGQDSPYKLKAAHDLNYIGFAGLLGQTGRRSGRPIIPGIQVADEAGGSLMAAMGILAAIIGRQKTGKGKYIDVSMMDSVFSLMVIGLGTLFGNNETTGRGEGLLTGGTPCYDVYETKDGRFMALGALEEKFWTNFCHAVERPDLVKDQFAEGTRLEEVRKEVEAIFKEKTRDEWESFFAEVDACCTPVLELHESIEDKHILDRKMVFEMDHPIEGKIKQLGFPIRFSDSSFEVKSLPPMWGEHTQEILTSLGFSEEDIQKLKEKKVI